MNRHHDIRLLLNACTAQEKKQLLKNVSPSHAAQQEQHFRLLAREPDLSAAEAARRLHLTDNQYKIACNKIYNNLQQGLRYTINTHQTEHLVKELQETAEVQNQRGMYADARKTLAKAIQLARHYELYTAEIALQYQLQQASLYMAVSTGPDTPEMCLQRIARLVQQQAQTGQLRLIYQQLLLLRYRHALCISPAEQQALAALVQQLETLVPYEDSITAQLLFYQARLLVCFMKGSTENIPQYSYKLLHLWQQHSHLIALHPELLIRSAWVQAYTNFLAGDVEQVSVFLDQYRQLADCYLGTPRHINRFAIIEFHTRLKILHKTYQYNELGHFFSKEWPGIFRMLHVMQEAEKIDILLSSCITLFTLKQYSQAEALLLEIKEVNRSLKRSDTLYFSFVFHCIILFEQREWSRLHSLINSEYHFLYRNKTLRPFERDMLLFIKKLPLITISTNGKRSLKAFLQKLGTYKQHPIQRLYFAYFDFYSWVESKMAGISYMDLVKRKALQATEVEA